MLFKKHRSITILIMRVAIIDLGTNSVRFDVHEFRAGKKNRLLYREKMMVRLGQGVFLKGKIDKQAMIRTLHAFKQFGRILDDLRVQKTIAFGTSALRESADGNFFVQKIKEETGIDVKIISGNEEAKLIAKGVLSNEKTLPFRFALVDIGGGSTEINICKSKKTLFGDSFILGTARLQQVFLKRSPPREDSIKKMRAYIRNILSQKMQEEEWPKVPVVIGSSGTVKAIAKILKKKKGEIPVNELEKLVKKMSGMTTAQLLSIPGMESKRADMILAGSILLEEIAWSVGAKKIVPTEYSLRDGIMEEELDLLMEHKSSRIELHMEDLFVKATRFGAEEKHLRNMVKLGENLFDRLRSIHHLDKKWRIYLSTAIILRKVGEVVGLSGHEKHSFYIIKNADFPSMQDWELEFVANLCLHHVSGKVSSKDLQFIGRDKKKKVAFMYLLALLRLVDALDIGPKTSLVLRRIGIKNKNVKLSFSGKATAGIESMVVERKKKLFEEVFKKILVLERA